MTEHIKIEVRRKDRADNAVAETYGPFESYAAAMDSDVAETIRSRPDWHEHYISYVAVEREGGEADET